MIDNAPKAINIYQLNLLIMVGIRKKFLVLSLIAGVSLCASIAMKNAEAKETQIWVGVAQSALWGSAAGPAGAVMGAVFGL